MIWHSFAFGFVTGLSSVFVIGGFLFYWHMRPYLKAAKAKKKKGEKGITPEMWLRDAAGIPEMRKKWRKP
jgi:hypothetical protein|tara:strand:- start:400 stop:609 length:210 start_codon:yes stop_codon:yes gene_type:complete